MEFSLILDVVVAILLMVTIGYAVVLNKRLGNLRRDKAELEKLALGFNDATTRAEDGIAELKATTDLLQGRIDKAESLRDDLVFLVDRGSSAADRLEEQVRVARDEAGVVPGRTVAPEATPGPVAEAADERRVSRAEAEDPSLDAPATDAERELLRAIRSAG